MWPGGGRGGGRRPSRRDGSEILQGQGTKGVPSITSCVLDAMRGCWLSITVSSMQVKRTANCTIPTGRRTSKLLARHVSDPQVGTRQVRAVLLWLDRQLCDPSVRPQDEPMNPP